MKAGQPQPASSSSQPRAAGLEPAGVILSPSAQILQPQQLSWASAGSVPMSSILWQAKGQGLRPKGQPGQRGTGHTPPAQICQVVTGPGQVCVCL